MAQLLSHPMEPYHREPVQTGSNIQVASPFRATSRAPSGLLWCSAGWLGGGGCTDRVRNVQHPLFSSKEVIRPPVTSLISWGKEMFQPAPAAFHARADVSGIVIQFDKIGNARLCIPTRHPSPSA